MLTNARGILTDRYTLFIKQNENNHNTQEIRTLENARIYDNLKAPYQLTKLKTRRAAKSGKITSRIAWR